MTIYAILLKAELGVKFDEISLIIEELTLELVYPVFLIDANILMFVSIEVVRIFEIYFINIKS